MLLSMSNSLSTTYQNMVQAACPLQATQSQQSQQNENPNFHFQLQPVSSASFSPHYPTLPLTQANLFTHFENFILLYYALRSAQRQIAFK